MWERGLRARRQRGRSQGNSHQRKSLVHESTGASAPKIDPSCVNADARRAAEAQCAHDIAPTPKSEASNAMGAESWPDHYRGMEITKFLRWIFATNRQRLRVRVRRHLLAKGIFGLIDWGLQLRPAATQDSKSGIKQLPVKSTFSNPVCFAVILSACRGERLLGEPAHRGDRSSAIMIGLLAVMRRPARYGCDGAAEWAGSMTTASGTNSRLVDLVH